MNTAQVLSLPATESKTTRCLDRATLFYSAAAALLLVVMLLGFQQFFLHGKAYPGREIPSPIRALVVLHGFGMAGWLGLFLIQPLLLACGKPSIHRLLGRFGAAFAVFIAIIGFRLAIESARISPADQMLWGLAPKPFMAIPLFSIAVFALLVGVGVWMRLKPKVHRPMMLLATLVAMSAATGRIDGLNALYQGTFLEAWFGPFFGIILIGGILLAIQWLMTQTIDRWLAIGVAGLAVFGALTMVIAATPAWQLIATFLLR